jgi:chromate transporter
MLLEVARIFLRLGMISFGGPLAHIALMRAEFVDRRAWISDQEFLDLNGAVNLIPGPNSTELAMHIGYLRGGYAGLWVAGTCFIAPAFVLVLLLSFLYARFNTLPQSHMVLWGIAPVVVGIIAQAMLKFAPSALKNRTSQTVAIASLGALMLGASEVAIVLGTALLAALLAFRFHDLRRFRPRRPLPSFLLLGAMPTGVVSLPVAVFWSFLKIGTIIYGSGYVLFAYMRAEFVQNLGWLSDRQLLDAVAVGQMTPGPLFTSATFVGYQISGPTGALAATAGIFLPSFFFVMLVAKFMGRVSGSPRARFFLDCVNAASFALMAAVTFQLALAALFPESGLDLGAMLIFCATALLLWKMKWSPTLCLALGALAGLLFGPRDAGAADKPQPRVLIHTTPKTARISAFVSHRL